MRVFVAVWPSDDVVEAIAGLRRPVTPGVGWTTRDHWHVTLRFLGEVADVDPVAAALAGASLPAATAELGPDVQRFTPAVAAVPVAGLDALAGAVDDALGAPDRAFRGHLTVARARRQGRIPPAATGAPIQAAWPVTEIALVRSRLGADGPRYDTLTTVSVPR
jgi:2'-5' RNA ligase